MSQAVIQSLESIIVDLPTIRPHKLAMHTMNRQTLVILRLRCSDGIEGLGEATTIGGLAYGSESPESIKSNLDAHFAPLLLGQPADNVNAAMQRLDRHIRGNTFARSAVETPTPLSSGANPAHRRKPTKPSSTSPQPSREKRFSSSSSAAPPAPTSRNRACPL
ncbi:hypothetical protein K3Z93_29915, partial [Pseudomonas aeruginosa]|nr:hypothetical protein [Pseudomonas aeruginosa]